jgi:acetyltransferase EpsM
MKSVVIMGGHSSGLIVAESIARAQAAGADARVLGFLNDVAAVGERIGPHCVLGGFGAWRTLAGDVGFIAAFPRPECARERYARLRGLGVPDERWATVVDPRAAVAEGARIAAGCYVGPFAVVEHGAHIGAHTMLRGGAYVSHDVSIGAFGFVGSNATLLGRTACALGVHVGSNAVCREGTRVGDYAVIGIGAVVVDDVLAGSVVAGNPARTVRA